MPLNEEARRLQTAEGFAEFLQVTPRAVYLWEEMGRIPTALRNNRMFRFRLEDVQQCLNPSITEGQCRYVELVVMALSLVCRPLCALIPKIDLGSITIDEVNQPRTRCAAHAADFVDLQLPQEQINAARGTGDNRLRVPRALSSVGLVS